MIWQLNRFCREAGLWVWTAVPRVQEVVPRQLQAIRRPKTREEWHQSHFNGSWIIAAALLYPAELRGGWLAPPPSLGPPARVSPPVTPADACGPTQREGIGNCGVALVSGLRFIKLVDNLETRFSAWTEKCQGFRLPAAGGRAGTKKKASHVC